MFHKMGNGTLRIKIHNNYYIFVITKNNLQQIKIWQVTGPSLQTIFFSKQVDCQSRDNTDPTRSQSGVTVLFYMAYLY